MPRGKTSNQKSNLSVIIPRRIHKQARVAYLRSGAPSFAAYVAWLMSKAPPQLKAADIIELSTIESALTDTTGYWS